MFIARAIYESKMFGRTLLKICSDYETEKKWRNENSDIELNDARGTKDAESVLHLCCERELPRIIMKLAVTCVLPVEFDLHKRDHIRLLEYTCNGQERFYNKSRKDYLSDKITIAKASEIIVYQDKCRCPRCYSEFGFDSIENVCGIIGLEEDPSKTTAIDLQRCKHCSTYFIDKQSLELYEKRYGRLNISRVSIEEFKRRLYRQYDDFYNPDSILSQNGYFASYDIGTRRRALIKMMENGVSKAQIKDKLSDFIHHRGNRCYMALPKWKSDLEFVNEYNIEKERRIEFITDSKEN